MGWLDRFLRGRRELLETAEPERAFAPDPSADTWQLASCVDNEKAIVLIRRDGLSLVSVASGKVSSLSAFAGGVLLFATAWEPYSAKTIGSMRGRVDLGEVKPFGVVFFENSRDEVTVAKSDAWYFPHAYVLASASEKLRPLIARVPFQLFVSASRRVERVVEGKANTAQPESPPSADQPGS